MSDKLICLGCFDDLAEPGTNPAYCIMCGMKHGDAVAASSRSHSVRSGRVGWDGMTERDLDASEDSEIYFDGWHDDRGRTNSRGQSLHEDGLLTRDPWHGGVWRGCHSCGELFEETDWPSSPRCDVCESGETVEV